MAKSDCIPLDMSAERASEYRRKAQECVAHAHRATDPNDKATWLQMAENWQRLADTTQPGLSIQVPPTMLADQEPKKLE